MSEWIEYKHGETPIPVGITGIVQHSDGRITGVPQMVCPDYWDSVVRYRPTGRRAPENTSDGSTASYYALPPNATELQDLISHRDMNAQIGEIFRAAYRYGIASHSDKLRDAKKIRFYIEAEIKRLEKENANVWIRTSRQDSRAGAGDDRRPSGRGGSREAGKMKVIADPAEPASS